VVFDSAQEKIVDNIDLKTDVPRTLILSPDKRKIYASTLNDNAIVTIDVATRKVLSSFTLNQANQNVRLVALPLIPPAIISMPSPHHLQESGIINDIEPAKFVVVDLAANTITRTAPFPQTRHR